MRLLNYFDEFIMMPDTLNRSAINLQVLAHTLSHIISKLPDKLLVITQQQ